MEKIKVAVVGYGGMGGWHADHLLNSDVAELAGIYDIKKERRQCAEKNGIYTYDTLDDVLSDKSVKIITVAIPNDSHEDVVIKALEAGKHVICEKPVALTLESLELMISTAKRNNVLFSTHQNRRWDVDFLAIKQIKESGEIGEVLDIESRVQGSRGIPSDWRCEKIHGVECCTTGGFI